MTHFDRAHQALHPVHDISRRPPGLLVDIKDSEVGHGESPELRVESREPEKSLLLSTLDSRLSTLYSAFTMMCPFCRIDNDRVLDSRSSQDGLAIRRRRECLHCDRRFTTYERPEETTIKVIKKDGSRVSLDRGKIQRGLERACWKRPISSRQIDATTTIIENDVYNSFEKEVNSRELGEIVMGHLRDLDEVAFVRFASVYRQFNDVHDFFEELRPMLEESRKTPR